MPNSKAVQLIVQSGMIPEEMLQQLVAWKLLPEKVKAQAGSRPVSLEREWRTVEDFVDTLGKVIEKESVELKETTIESNGRFERVDLIFNKEPTLRELALVGDNCVTIPATIKKHPEAVVLHGEGREVLKVEERFHCGELTTLVCHFKPA